MNKEKFLTELREYLSILENQEQEDILAEYSQHIDMKMQKGLSEEEAIRDFGSMEELAAQILEAYHVKPEFHKKNAVFKIPKPKTGNVLGLAKTKTDDAGDGVSFIKHSGMWIRKAWTRTVHGIKAGFRWLSGKCRAFTGWLAKPFTGKKEESWENAGENRIIEERAKEMGGHLGKLCKAVGHGIIVLWNWLIRFCVFLLRFMWNAAWLLIAVFSACMAMIVLMGIGAMPVLLSQGYPLVGVFIICVGGLLCLGSLSYGAFGMLIRKKLDDSDVNNRDEDREKSGKEEVYEQTI